MVCRLTSNKLTTILSLTCQCMYRTQWFRYRIIRLAFKKNGCSTEKFNPFDSINQKSMKGNNIVETFKIGETCLITRYVNILRSTCGPRGPTFSPGGGGGMFINRSFLKYNRPVFFTSGPSDRQRQTITNGMVTYQIIPL